MTLTELAISLGVRRHRLAYALRRHGVPPARFAGTVGLYGKSSAARAREALDRVSRHPNSKARSR